MAEHTSHAPGTPSWVDLFASDLDGAQDFYSTLFGWDIEDQFDDDGNRIYAMARVDGKAVAGMGSIPPGVEMPSIWNTYIATDDIDATAQAVEANGGQVLMPPMQVMESGKMASFADPTGAAFSAWQAQQHIGAELGNIANTHSWNELMTRDLSSAQEFYSNVFDWQYEVQQMPDGEYHVIAGGENGGLGGMMTMPNEVPAMVPNYWGVYFTVDDLDASTAKVQELGGQVVMPAMELPGIGQMSTVHDTWGAPFTLIQPNDQSWD